MGVPSCCLCWLHNSGVSTPSVFSQSKNTLGLTLNHLDISFPRPNLKAIFFLSLSPHRIYTQTHTSPKKTELLIHVRSRKYHPQTIGREERYHGSLKLGHLYRVLPSNRTELIEEVKKYRQF